jgi:hypothetical protein
MRRETHGPIRSKQAEARSGGGQDHRRDGDYSPIGQFSLQDMTLGKIIGEQRRSHGTQTVRVFGEQAGSNLRRYQSRFGSIGQQPRRQLARSILPRPTRQHKGESGPNNGLSRRMPIQARSREKLIAATPQDHFDIYSDGRSYITTKINLWITTKTVIVR